MARRSPKAGRRRSGATSRCSPPIWAGPLAPRWRSKLPEPLLEFRGVNTHYGDLHVLKDVNYTIMPGEIVSLLGGNACGKSTTMKTIMGVVRPTTGSVLVEGNPIERLPTNTRVERGIAPVLEARRLFPRMTVFENLEMGAYTQARGPQFQEDLERV